MNYRRYIGIMIFYKKNIFILILFFVGSSHASPCIESCKIRLSTKIGTTSQTILDITSLANNALPAKNGIRTGGSDNRTNISAAYADDLNNSVSVYLSPKGSRPRYIFFGGADNLYKAASISPALINSGKVALYEHANGMSGLTVEQRQTLQTTFAPTGSSITTGGGNAMAEVGMTINSGYVFFFGGTKYPNEVNVNLNVTGTYIENGLKYGNYFTSNDLARYEAIVDKMAGIGVKNAAAIMNADGFAGASYIPDFATNSYWKNIRTAALYGGGISFDTPPTFAIWQGSVYINSIISEIKWALANHIRVTWIISPYNVFKGSGCVFDPDVWNNTARLLDIFIRNHAVPTSYAVETYCGAANTTINPLTGSTDLSGSMDHIVSMLLTAPVSPAGTATPTSGVAGMTSESESFAPRKITGVIGLPTTTDTYQQVIADVNSPQNGTNIIGSLGYQSADRFMLATGNLGSTVGLSKINVYLSNSSSFLSQTPLLLQGTGNSGIPEISGSFNLPGITGNDPYVHIYSNGGDETTQGIAIGKKFTSPVISSDSTNTNIIIKNGGIAVEGTTFNVSKPVVPNFQGYVQTWNEGGIGEPDFISYHGRGVGGFGWYDLNQKNDTKELLMQLNHNTLHINGGKLSFDSEEGKNSFQIGNNGIGDLILGSHSSLSRSGNLTVNNLNISGDLIANNNIMFRNSKNGTSGIQFQGKTGTLENSWISGDGSGGISLGSGAYSRINGTLQLIGYSKSQILKISNPAEGEIINDSTDHIPVIYENGAWYKLTLGAILSQ